MRDKARKAIRAIVDESLDSALTMLYSDLKQDIRTTRDLTEAAIAKVQPASVELDQALADRIVEKMHGPLTIPQAMSDWARKEAEYHDMQTYHRLGYSAMALDARWTIQANGTIALEVLDVNGARLWSGTFVPPDFGKAGGA